MKKLLFIAGALVSFLLFGGAWWFFTANAFSRALHSLVQQEAGFGGTALVLSLPAGAHVAVISGIKGDYHAFEKIRQDLLVRGRITQGNTLADDTIIVFNGNCVDKADDNREILTTMANLMLANPYKVFYLIGPQEEQWLSSHEYTGSIQRFFEILPRGMYLFAEDDDEPSVRISPSDYKRFAHIACVPVSNKGPIRAVCTLGSVCALEEGQLSRIILGSQEVTYTEITVSSSLAMSTITSLSADPPHTESLISPAEKGN